MHSNFPWTHPVQKKTCFLPPHPCSPPSPEVGFPIHLSLATTGLYPLFFLQKLPERCFLPSYAVSYSTNNLAFLKELYSFGFPSALMKKIEIAKKHRQVLRLQITDPENSLQPGRVGTADWHHAWPFLPAPGPTCCSMSPNPGRGLHKLAVHDALTCRDVSVFFFLR